MSEIVRLVLNYHDLAKKTENLYEELRRSQAKRELFVRDPAAVLSARVFDGKDLKRPARLDATNRVIFSLLSNPKFFAWARAYEQRIFRELSKAGIRKDTAENRRKAYLILGRRRIFRDMAEGLAKYGDPELFRSLIAVDQASLFAQVDDGDFVPHIAFIDSIFAINTGVAINNVFILHNSIFTDTKSGVFLYHEQQSTSVSTTSLQADSQADAQADSQAQAETEAVAQSELKAATESEAEAGFQSSVESEAGSQTESGSESQAGSESGAESAADSASESGAESGSDTGSESGAESGSDSETGTEGALGGIYGLSRVELQQFASMLVAGMATYASSLRDSGALLKDGPIEESLKE